MRLDIDFDLLDTYMSVYGVHAFSGSNLKVYLSEGLGVALEVRDLFSRRYFYDPWNGNKYSEVKKVDGLLVGRLEDSDEWVEYEDKTISSEILKYEYVGGCWLVFENVYFFAKKIDRYISDSKVSEGVEVEGGSRLPKASGANIREYFLEGLIGVAPGPGWMTLEVHAESFYLEVPDR